MPRSLVISSRVWEVGTYGPLNLDGFTNANTEALVFRLKWENWPQGVLLGQGFIEWSDTTRASFDINGTQPRSLQGPLEWWTLSVGVRNVGGKKAAVSGATGGMTVFVPFTAALEFYAE